MNIPKAIEIQDLYLHHSDQWNHQDLDTAIKLGIEALKAVQSVRTSHPGALTYLLLDEEPE